MAYSGHRTQGTGLKCNRGSMVVEASLIFPIVFLAIIAVIYFCMIIYQKAYIQSLADMAAERGAQVWDNSIKNISTGGISKENLKAEGLYWRLIDFKGQEKKEKVERYILERLDKHAVLGFAEKPEVVVNLHDYLVYKVLEVQIAVKYKVPVGGILKIFGLSDKYSITAYSKAVINEPVEFIRNTDFVLDLEHEFEKAHPGYRNIVNSIRSGMDSIKTRINNFFAEKEG